MHRIDTSGHVLGRFSGGNPEAGQLATRLSPDWFNDVQENIIEVLEQAGIPLVKGAENQLYLAITALIASGGGGGGGPAEGVPITRLINTLGLLTGGGALGNDLNLSVAKATAAEIAAGVADDKAITPAGLAAASAFGGGGTDYVRLTNGLILMWGTAVATANANTIITLPSTFPAACLFAVAEGGKDADVGANENNPFVNGRGLSTLSVWNTRNENLAINYFAFGK